LEGESELISGFNVEIASLTFVYLFLREYGIIMVISVVAVIMVGGSPIYIVVLALALLFIRRCYPRIRYDSLIEFI
jgi:NADH:ubiquinone oxidoreductase subunit H